MKKDKFNVFQQLWSQSIGLFRAGTTTRKKLKHPPVFLGICVIATVLGIADLWAMVNSQMLLNAINTQSQEFLKLQQETTKQIEVITQPWKGINRSILALRIIGGGTLIGGGILAYFLRPIGQPLLMGALILTILSEIATLTYSIPISIAIADINVSYAIRSAELREFDGKEMAPVMKARMRAALAKGIHFGIAVSVFTTLAKVSFCVASIIYFHRERKKSLRNIRFECRTGVEHAN